MSNKPSKLATRRHFVVVGGGAALGCALPACSYRRPYDSQAIDLRGFNVCDDTQEDCTDTSDMSIGKPQDMRQPPDLTHDLSGVDLKGVDLSQPPADLSQPPDLVQPRDMTVPATCKIPVPAAYFPTGLNQTLYWPDYKVFFARDARGYFALWNFCQHAGCQTAFNAGALTYDCPCHGSRYNFDGSVLRGPTTRPLYHQTLCWTDGTKRAFLYDNNSYISDVNQRLT